MMRMPHASLGSNWVTAVFECPPKKLPKLLTHIFDWTGRVRYAFIPNYTIREHEPRKTLRVSVRVLAVKKHHEEVERALVVLAKKMRIKVDTPGKHSWIKRGTRSEWWSRERCEILHVMSVAAVRALAEGVPGPRLATWDLSRRNYAHVFVNMLGLREGFRDIAGESKLM